MIEVRCPNGHRLRVPHEYLGKKGRCRYCQTVFVLSQNETPIGLPVSKEVEGNSAENRDSKLPETGSDEKGRKFLDLETSANAGRQNASKPDLRKIKRERKGPDLIWRIVLALAVLVVVVWVVLPMLLDIRESLHGEVANAQSPNLTAWEWFFGRETQQPPVSVPTPLPTSSPNGGAVVEKTANSKREPKKAQVDVPIVSPTPVQDFKETTAEKTVVPNAGDEKEKILSIGPDSQSPNEVVRGGMKTFPNSKIVVFDLPRSYTDFAVNSETGDILAVESASKESHFYRRTDLEAGKVEPAKIGKVKSTPMCVCFKRYQQDTFFVVGTMQGDAELLNGSTGELTSRHLGHHRIAMLACSTNPEDPYVYFTSGAGSRDVYGISLPSKLLLTRVVEANSQISISPDGSRLYFETHGSARCLVLGERDFFNPPKVLQIFHHPGPGSRYLPDPFNYSVSAGTMLFSRDLKPLLEKLPKIPQCYFRKRPIVICGDGTGEAPELGRINYLLSAVSYNSCATVGKEVQVSLNFSPGASPTEQDLNSKQYQLPTPRRSRVFADDERESVLFAGNNQLAIIPLSEFAVPEEPLIAARLECPAIMQAERDNTIRVVVESGGTVLDAKGLTPGMRLGEPNEIIWRPILDQIGVHGIQATVKSGTQERTLSSRVEVVYPSLQFTLPIEGVRISPDGTKGVIWGKSNPNLRIALPQDKAGEEYQGEVKVVDLKTGESTATVCVPDAILSVDVSDRLVLISTRLSAGDVEITLYDAKTLQEFRRYPLNGARLNRTMFCEERLLLEMSGVLKVLDCETLNPVYQCDRFNQLQRAYFRVESGSRPICNGMELNEQFQPTLMRTPPRSVMSFPADTPSQNFDHVKMNVTSPDNSLKGGDGVALIRQVSAPFGRAQISLSKTELLRQGQFRNGVDLYLSVRGGIQGKQRIFHSDTRPSFVEDNSTIRLFAGGGSAIATVGDRAYLWRLPEGLPSEGLSIWPKNPPRFLREKKREVLSHITRGGKGPYEYWLLGGAPGVEIDDKTGEVTVDGDKIEQAALPLIEKAVLGNQGSEERLDAVMERMLPPMIDEIEGVTGEKIAGYPVAIPIHLRVTDQEGELSQYRYYIVYEVSRELLKQRLSEAQNAQNEAVRERLAKAKQRAEEFAKRRARENSARESGGAGNLSEGPFGAMDPKEVEVEVLASLDDALFLLEQGKVLEFQARYMPIENFRSIRKEMGRLMKEMVSHPPRSGKENATYVQLQKFQGGEVELAEGGFVAYIRRRPILGKPEEEKEGPEGEDELKLRWEADEHEPLKGYGSDLKKALEDGVESLEKSELQKFIEQMYPAGELRRLRAEQGTGELLRQFETEPRMITRMISDMKECLATEPKFDDSGNEAMFELGFHDQLPTAEGAKPPGRMIRFQKVEGSWRFYDNTSARRKEISRMAKQRPPPLQFVPLQRTRNQDEPILTMEKIGSEWRIQRFPVPFH